jgi:hypothetical protein
MSVETRRLLWEWPGVFRLLDVDGLLVLVESVSGAKQAVTDDEARALYRALGQHLGVEPLPGWRALVYTNGKGLRVEQMADWNWGGVFTPDDTDDFKGYRVVELTAADAMKACEALAGKEKPAPDEEDAMRARESEARSHGALP